MKVASYRLRVSPVLSSFMARGLNTFGTARRTFLSVRTSPIRWFAVAMTVSCLRVKAHRAYEREVLAHYIVSLSRRSTRSASPSGPRSTPVGAHTDESPRGRGHRAPARDLPALRPS